MPALSKDDIIQLQRWAKNHPEWDRFCVVYGGVNFCRGHFVNEFVDDTSYKDTTILEAISSFEDKITQIRAKQGSEFENESRILTCDIWAGGLHRMNLQICFYDPEQFGNDIRLAFSFQKEE